MFEKENRVRMFIYELFKNGFSYPTRDVYKYLKESKVKEIKEAGFDFLNDIPPLSDLQVIYTTYFDVVFNGKGCHIRESEYLRRREFIPNLLLECKGFYKNFGLYLQPNELPDALDIELEFMYYLSYLLIKNGGSIEREKELSIYTAQRDFINRHLMKFVESFIECTNRYAELKFYNSMAVELLAFLEEDVEFLDLAIDGGNERKESAKI